MLPLERTIHLENDDCVEDRRPLQPLGRTREMNSDCGKQGGRAPLAFKTRKVSEIFRYRNSPEGCETNRTIRCFIGERDGLGGFRLEGW